MTDMQWQLIQPLLLLEQNGPGRPIELDMRQVVNAIFYVVRTGCQWEYLPGEYPNHNSVYYHYRKWCLDGTWQAVNEALRQQERERQGRKAEPNAGIIPPPGAGPFELSLPGKLESLFSEAGLQVLASDEVDCPFHWPDFETFWRAVAASGPMQGTIQAIGEAKLKAALRETAEPLGQADGSIPIQPNVFKYVVAVP